MYGCESWIVKKAEHQCIDAFELWCWRRLSRVPRTARGSNLRKSVLNIHWKDWCWSLNSNTLATYCVELIYWKRPWCWKRLKAGGEEDDQGWDGCWVASPTLWARVWVVGDGQGSLEYCRERGWKESDRTERLNWNIYPKSKVLKVFIMPYWNIDYFLKHSQD